jgi:hypothetical protein
VGDQAARLGALERESCRKNQRTGWCAQCHATAGGGETAVRKRYGNNGIAGTMLGEKIPPNFFTFSCVCGSSRPCGQRRCLAWQSAASTTHQTYWGVASSNRGTPSASFRTSLAYPATAGESDPRRSLAAPILHSWRLVTSGQESSTSAGRPLGRQSAWLALSILSRCETLSSIDFLVRLESGGGGALMAKPAPEVAPV